MAKKQPKDKSESAPKSIQNRKAYHEYEIIDTFEAGLVLAGSEVKSVFHGRANLTDAYCKVTNGEAWLINADIEPYENASFDKTERRRDRKLLLHKREIDQIDRKSKEKGFTIVALKIYFKNRKAKVEIGLARGKSHYDKREALAKKDERRELERMRSLRRP
ncbi:MAG: SsrA-binding protein SmpB [Armatimonadetes bacterium]|nr:SsrA-binding protein SmpB [Armatimonadota bacterium]